MRRRFRRSIRRPFIRRRYRGRRRAPRRHTGNGTRFFKLSRVISTGLTANLNTITNNPNNFTDWSNIAALFQFYKPHAIKLRWIPFANTKEMSSAEIDQQHPIYIVHDWNATTETVTEQFMLSHEKLAVKSNLKMWSYYKKLVNTVPTSLAAAGSLFSGYLQTSIPNATNQIQIWNPGPLIDGRLIVNLYLTAKMRQ